MRWTTSVLIVAQYFFIVAHRKLQ